MVKQYVEYYTKPIKANDFERFGIYKQAKDNILIRQIELEQMILDRGQLTAIEMNELMHKDYMFVSDEGLILSNWEDFKIYFDKLN